MKDYIFIGGSHGISKSAISMLLAEEPSARVHLYCREPMESAFEGRVLYRPFDVLSGESIDVSSIPFENFAGYVYSPGTINLKSFTALKLEDFKRDLEINLFSNIKILQTILPAARASLGVPSFVFYSTIAVSKGMPMHASIAVAKAAVEGLSTSLSAEYAPKMRFNVVAPSLTETPLSQPLVGRESIKKTSEEKHPLKRIGTADDVASCVVFLLSDKSSWMTGQVLRPDGGLSL